MNVNEIMDIEKLKLEYEKLQEELRQKEEESLAYQEQIDELEAKIKDDELFLTPKLTLPMKLLRIMDEVEWIKKKGKNEKQNYSFVREADVLANIQRLMVKYRLLFYPDLDQYIPTEVQTKNSTQQLTTVINRYIWLDCESRETLSFRMLGQGADSLDKGSNKAVTGSQKYALLKFFNIPTGDDAEKPNDLYDEPITGYKQGERLKFDPIKDEKPEPKKDTKLEVRALLDELSGDKKKNFANLKKEIGVKADKKLNDFTEAEAQKAKTRLEQNKATATK